MLKIITVRLMIRTMPGWETGFFRFFPDLTDFFTIFLGEKTEKNEYLVSHPRMVASASHSLVAINSYEFVEFRYIFSFLNWHCSVLSYQEI